MRFTRLIPFLVLAAGCGDNGTNNPGRTDARPTVDSGEDEDAPPDGPPGSAGRVWVVGDFLTDNTRQVGSFSPDATLPISAAMPPPAVFPASGRVSSNSEFQAHTNGTKIAYVADATVAGRFDLYVAAADGSNPVLVVEGATPLPPPAPAPLIDITAVVLSPDGSKVAFTRDSLVNNGYDLWLAPTTAAAVPVMVSARTGLDDSQDVFLTSFTWSADSKYLGFAGDTGTSGKNQPFVVDTTLPVPVGVAFLPVGDITGTGTGVNGAVVFDAQNNVYFRAAVTGPDFELFTAPAADPTPAARVKITLPGRTDATVPDVDYFGITPDGTKLVYSADAPVADAYNLYVATTAAPNTSTKITDQTTPGTVSGENRAQLWFSPDNTKVAVVGTWMAAAFDEPFVVHLDGSATRRLATIACSNCDVNILQWDPDGTTIWAMGDIRVGNDTEVYKLDSTMADQVPTLAVDPPDGGDVFNMFVRP
ncbi:MAG: hypothetical protein WKG01_39580 [Kofleriaceae bacterium]